MAEGQGGDGHLTGGQLSAAISNRIVQVISEYTGRGPTRARTFLNDSVVVCVLQDTLTKGERALAEHGEQGAVIDMRRTFQSTMADDAKAAIEELTGRQVIAFMSDNHISPDIAVEVFMLESLHEPEAEAPQVASSQTPRAEVLASQ